MTHPDRLTAGLGGAASRLLLLSAVILLVFAALLDPADQIFHLKIPAFSAVVLISICRRGLFRKTVSGTVWTATIATAVVVPLAWTLLGLLNFGLHSGDTQFATLKSFLFLLILPVLICEDIDLASLVKRMGIVLVALTFFMVAVSFISPAIFLVLYEFCLAKQCAIITTSRDLLGVGLGQFYYKTSALMIFPFAHYCARLFHRGNKSFVPLCMVLCYSAALLFSGTRANFLAAVFVGGVIALVYIRASFGLTASVVVALLGAILLSITLIPKFTQPDEESNSIKLAHLRSYEKEFDEHPEILLWGQGTETGFYSEGFQDWTTVTELSFMELIRVFGIPITVLFSGGLAWIGFALYTRRSYSALLAYIAYVAIAGSNPLLISSTGFIIISAMWKEAVLPSTSHSAFHLPEHRKSEPASRSRRQLGFLSIKLLKEASRKQIVRAGTKSVA
jgi:hypothetical protein